MLKKSFVALFVVASAALAAAQQAGFTRTVLQQSDISAPGREVVTARVEFNAGASVGRHTHFGEEIAYVVDGTLEVETDGVMKTVTTGEAFIIPAGKPHNARNTGAGRAILVVTYVVEKGKPLATQFK